MGTMWFVRRTNSCTPTNVALPCPPNGRGAAPSYERLPSCRKKSDSDFQQTSVQGRKSWF
jgi:hypothetical protein